MKFLTRKQSLFVKVVWVMILVLTVQIPLQAGAAPLQGAAVYSAISPEDVIVAYLDNDSHLDIAVAEGFNETISVRLGNGDGTFGGSATYSTGGRAVSLTHADFNGDGNMDLATANWSSYSISILLGNGDGTFGAASVIPVGAGKSPIFIASEDFNKDGDADLAVTYQAGNDVLIMLGNGDGTFGASSSFGTAAATYQVTTGDFNEDGDPDLVVSSFTDRKVSVLLGNGDGTFAAKVDYSSGQYTQRVVAGDLNRDGHLDLVASNSSGSVSILLGNGDGTFQNTVNQSTRGADPRAVQIGDFIGDGELDIIVGNFGNGTDSLSFLTGIGDGTFEAAKRYSYSGDGGGTRYFASGDFDEDGLLELVVSRQNVNSLYVLLANHRNADLQSLSLSGGAALSHNFSPGTLDYTSSVANNVYRIAVTPTVVDATATVTVAVYGGTPELVTSGTQSSELPLNVGVNTIEVVVTAQDGMTTKTYTVEVTRQLNTDASLSGLGLSGGVVLSPGFSAGTFGYTSSVAYSVDTMKVTPIADATAAITVQVNGGTPKAVASGAESSELPLNVGVNTIDVVVTAQDGTTIQTYTVEVTRSNNTGGGGAAAVTPARSANAKLSGLSLTGGAVFSPAFSPGVLSYTSSVSNQIGSVSVISTLADGKAAGTIQVNGGTPQIISSGQASGALTLNVGVNVIEVVVMAEDGTKQSYVITVTRQAESGAEPQTPVCTFTDIQTHWAKVKICKAAGFGIVEGMSANLFAPDKTVTRAEFAVMLLRTLQVPINEQATAPSFTDMESIPDWAVSAISTGVAVGMLDGYTDGTFRPQQTITRSEMAAMIAKAMKWQENSEQYLTYSDGASIPVWARPYVEAVLVNGLLQGRGGNLFVPNGITTRAEAAVVMLRLWDTQN